MAKAKTSFFGWGWLNVGHVVSAGSFVSGPKINLPSEVDSMQFLLIQTLPSYVTIAIQIIFKSEPSQELEKLLSQEYEEEREPTEFGHRIHSPERLKKKVVSEYLDGLNIKIEKFLSGHFKGTFLKTPANKPACPFMRLFSLTNIPLGDDEKTLEWIRDNSHFLENFNIVPISWYTYRLEEYLLFDIRSEAKTPEVSIWASEEAFDEEGRASGFWSIEAAINLKYSIAFMQSTEFHALSKLVSIQLSDISHIRSKAFSKETIMFEGSAKSSYKRFSDQIDEYTKFNELAISINRLDQEFEGINERFLFRDIPKFRPLEERLREDNKHFWQIVFENVNSRRKTLAQEVKFLTEFFRTKFSINKNIADFQTQNQIRVLTIVVVILTSITAIFAILQSLNLISWDNLLSWFKLIKTIWS